MARYIIFSGSLLLSAFIGACLQTRYQLKQNLTSNL